MVVESTRLNEVSGGSNTRLLRGCAEEVSSGSTPSKAYSLLSIRSIVSSDSLFIPKMENSNTSCEGFDIAQCTCQCFFESISSHCNSRATQYD